MPGPAAHLIEAALAAADGTPAAVPGRALGVGWATVELERAIPALAADVGISPALFLPADDSVALGARCRVAHAILEGGRSLVLLEPSTEGRLASILARQDEGPWVAWIAAAEDDDADVPVAVGPSGPGPFGRERLVFGGPVDDLHRLLVSAPPGTIRP